ncbi:5-formyltetrahydrofolate cyclo-ligase, partial [bacterium]|nr:5-formyltetrahydrofolate cyclo-ligase [bacterium]
MDKAQLRRDYRARRTLFKKNSVEFLSACKALSSQVSSFLSEFPLGSKILSYQAYGSEAPVPWVDGFQWAYPRMRSPEEMDFLFVKESGVKGWLKNQYGIFEPNPKTSSICTPGEADLIFVPALSFDRSGLRLGGGMGFYDRFLAPLKEGVLKIGIGFHTQLHSGELPRDAWDIPLDGLMTERGLIGFLR